MYMFTPQPNRLVEKEEKEKEEEVKLLQQLKK